MLLILWVRQKFRVRHVSGGWWRRQRLKQLVNIGYPAALEQGVFQLGFFIFLIVIGNNYGTEAFAAYNIGVNILAICMTVGFGFSIAGSTLVGQHLGAKDFSGAVRSGWRSMYLAIASMGLIGLAIMIYAQALAKYFIGDGDLTIEYTVQFIYVLGAMMPLLAVEFAIGGALRGAGDTRFPLSRHDFGAAGNTLRLSGSRGLLQAAGNLGLRGPGRRLYFERGAADLAFSPGSMENDYSCESGLLSCRFARMRVEDMSLRYTDSGTP